MRRVLIESEAHLRDSIDAGVAAGLEEGVAVRSALDRFGTAAQVADSVNKTVWAATRWRVYGAVAAMLVRLVAAGMILIGVAAGVAGVVAALTSKQAVFGLPSGVLMPGVGGGWPGVPVTDWSRWAWLSGGQASVFQWGRGPL